MKVSMTMFHSKTNVLLVWAAILIAHSAVAADAGSSGATAGTASTGKPSPASMMQNSSEANAEMIGRMRRELASLAAEYGNPPFTFIFSNSEVDAQKIQEKTRTLALVAPLDEEISKRNVELRAINEEIARNKPVLESQRTELARLGQSLPPAREEAEALDTRITRLRRAVAAADAILNEAQAETKQVQPPSEAKEAKEAKAEPVSPAAVMASEVSPSAPPPAVSPSGRK